MIYLSEVEKSTIKGKTVLLRVDFNVPINEGKISDYSRIELVIPTIKYLLSINASIILFHILADQRVNPHQLFHLNS